MAVVGQQLLAPESGWRRYDNTTPLIGYIGTFKDETQTGTYLGSQRYSHTDGDYIKFLFKGTKLRIISSLYNTVSTNIPIYIDGVSYTYNGYLAGTNVIYSALLFEEDNLEDTLHEVIIKHANDKKVLVLDAIDIDADGELIRHDYFDNTHLDEPMKKYGVAHFGFDEASGNVYDKLGSNYVGTVTGATRVAGWNGEGNAIKASGINQTVQFNNPVIPTDEFSIKFKIKCLPNTATAGQYFISTLGSTSDLRGFFLAIVDEGYLVHSIVTDANATTSNGYNFNKEQKRLIADGKWHEILVSKTNSYIDVYTLNNGGYYRTKLNNSKLVHAGNLLLLNRVGMIGTAGRNLNGELDDLQIYSKALTPSDFSRHHVAIKTIDNKTLTLPKREGRVKELPTAEEVDLINQGYAWREIDEAVDATGFDLTQTTTEYEIVSKTNSTLGNGKMFTIPINEFKTIKIEGNY